MKNNMPSYSEIIALIQKLNAFIDDRDVYLLSLQQQYAANKNKAIESFNNSISKFNSDCEKAINDVRTKSYSLIDDAKRIGNDVNNMDEHLSNVDKYYIKTKKKKEEELTGTTDQKYYSGDDYFSTLSQIKKDYQVISKKYTEDILPSILNGLNYIFSSKRKQDYEELIVLKNTIKAFIGEIEDTIPEITAETIDSMRKDYEKQLEDQNDKQNKLLSSIDNNYMNMLERCAVDIDVGLESILPDNVINNYASIISDYYSKYMKINKGNTILNGVLYLGFIEYPAKELIQSKTLASFVVEKCKKLFVDGSIRFPVVIAEDCDLPIYILSDNKENDKEVNLIQGAIFSFLSSVPVSKLSIDVIDCENHGNSVMAYYDAKKKLPELFGNRLNTTADECSEVINRVNEKVEYISQNLLGSHYNSVFEYAKENDNFELNYELLTIFDFPKGLDDKSVMLLKNIIINGPKCGIYTMISDCAEDLSDMYSKNYSDTINKIKKESFVLQQISGELFVKGLRFGYLPMPGKEEFGSFFSKYILINESIKNRGIAFPEYLNNLLGSSNDIDLERSISDIRATIGNYNATYGICPSIEQKQPDSIMLGVTAYPKEIFEDNAGYERITSAFGVDNRFIGLPLLINHNQLSNVYLSYSADSENDAVRFSNHILWCFLSKMPVNGLNVIVFDPERKGSSILPFLDLKKQNPELFDENIYTDSSSFNDRLTKLNRYIDSLIQEKLGNRFETLYDYNINTPRKSEKYHLILVYDFPNSLSPESFSLLQNVMKNGYKCGVYTIICANKAVKSSSYYYDDDKSEMLKSLSSVIECKGGNYNLLPFNLSIAIKEPISFNRVNQFIEDYSENSKKLKNQGLSFRDILDNNLFGRDTSKGLAIPVGIGDGDAVVSIVFGKGSSHHALIAGATGSGKSTLLHTIIMSSMLHYSPDLLNLYLMDFKSGTEFKLYDNKRLPHIKLLALDAMQEFGESILEDLVNELSLRSEAFKQVGAHGLSEYVKLSGLPMPRILVIMDEFQILFNDATNRKVAYNCAELTKRIVTEGRSYGIHLVMATQSTKIINDLTIESGTIEQMRIRIGLKCGEWDASYLFTDKNDIDALEMMKGPIGTAVMNMEYTEDKNIGFRAAYCDEKTQEELLNTIAERFADHEYSMRSFEGNKVTNLFDTDYGKLPMNDNRNVSAEIGDLIKVAPPLKLEFDCRRKHNTLICGSNERMCELISNLLTYGILKNKNAVLYCFDGEYILDPTSEGTSYGAFGKFNERMRLARSRGDIVNFINEIYEQYADRKKYGGGSPIFIQIKNLQFLDLIKDMLKGEMINEAEYTDAVEENDEVFDFGSDNAMGVSDKLLKLIDDGNAYNIHIIISSNEYQSVKDSMYYGENVLSKFPNRFIFSLNESDADSLIDGVSLSSLRNNMVYYTDHVRNTFQVKPYIIPDLKELEDKIDNLIGGE